MKSLCKTFTLSDISLKDFSARHSVPHSTMKRCMKKFLHWKSTGVDLFHNSSGGRPSLLDDTGIINVRQRLREAVTTQSCQDSMVTPFHIWLEGEVSQTNKRRGLAAIDCRVSKKSVKRIKTNNNFIEVTCQFKTFARSFAESDPRNLYSFAIMNASFLMNLSPGMIFNWVATQYCINPDGHAVIVKCQGDNSTPAEIVKTGDSQDRIQKNRTVSSFIPDYYGTVYKTDLWEGHGSYDGDATYYGRILSDYWQSH